MISHQEIIPRPTSRWLNEIAKTQTAWITKETIFPSKIITPFYCIMQKATSLCTGQWFQKSTDKDVLDGHKQIHEWRSWKHKRTIVENNFINSRLENKI